MNKPVITGEHLKIARVIYGFTTQEDLGNVLGVSVSTIQRYENLTEVDSKTLGVYVNDLGFDITKVVLFVGKARHDLQMKKFSGQIVHQI